MPRRDLLNALASLAGLPAVITAGDMWSAMLNLGLIARTASGGEEFIATAPAIAAWDSIALPPETVRAMLDSVERHLNMPNREIVSDVHHLVRWAPTGVLTATAAALADRLAFEPEQVLRALQGIERNWPVLIEPDPAAATTQTTFNIRSMSP
jgi:hypothetical protein